MFVLCGEALWDLFAVEGEDGLTFDARFGGSPFNAAVGLARLGQPVALFAGLSTDRLGDRLAAVLKAEGVETRYLNRSPRPTTLSLVDVGPDGGPRYAIYGEGAADRAITPADLPDLGPEVWGVHAGSFALVVEPIGPSLLALWQREAGRRLLTLDPNVRLNVEPDAATWRERVDRFVPLSDLVKVSEEDLDLLHPGEAAADIARRWLQTGAGLVVVTRGPDGAEAFGQHIHVTVPGRAVDVIDTVGAGDTFQAALIAGLAERNVRDGEALRRLGAEQVASLLDFANRAASMACTRRGADTPRRAEIPDPGEPAR